MHLNTIIVFSLLLWWPSSTAPQRQWADLAPVAIYLLVITVVARSLAWRTCNRLRGDSVQRARALVLYHRGAGALRFFLLAGFAYLIFSTPYPAMLNGVAWLTVVPGIAPLVGVAPYCLGLILVWWFLFPAERAARRSVEQQPQCSRAQYITFNFRHQFLVLAIPLATLFLVYATTEQYRQALAKRLGTQWAPDIILGATVMIVFILAPLIMRYVWTTSPLPDGPLRRRLLTLCDRIGLNVREILVWHSDKMMANAAVMGIIPQFRYILLSDALLEAMTDDEVEAVFGHEAGHVRHHHIPYFIIFAWVSLLFMQAVMEGLFLLRQNGIGVAMIDRQFVEIAGIASVLPLWLLGFGAISRRFERQADVYGASCASPDGSDRPCMLACSLHDATMRNAATVAPIAPSAVCASGIRVFISALRKVADLNGIAIREWSWRHSSISHRITFLAELAGDGRLAGTFARRIRRIKMTLLATCLVGVLVGGIYVAKSQRYRRDVDRNFLEPIKRIFRSARSPD